MAFVTVRSVVRSWIDTFLNSASNAENISVSISPVKNRPVRNPTPVILDIIIAPLVWMSYFFAEIVADTGREKDASHLRITFVKSVKIDKAMSNAKARTK
jgi:hypothetical protein